MLYSTFVSVGSPCARNPRDVLFQFDWFIWPPTQWVNFMYVPDRYRVMYVNVVTVLWDVFLSYIKHRVSHALPPMSC